MGQEQRSKILHSGLKWRSSSLTFWWLVCWSPSWSLRATADWRFSLVGHYHYELWASMAVLQSSAWLWDKRTECREDIRFSRSPQSRDLFIFFKKRKKFNIFFKYYSILNWTITEHMTCTVQHDGGLNTNVTLIRATYSSKLRALLIITKIIYL